MQWRDIYKPFQLIHEKLEEGPSKISSGYMSVSFTLDGNVEVMLGGYDIPGWNRHKIVGYFGSEEEAMEETIKQLKEAEKLIDGFKRAYGDPESNK